MSRTIEAPSEWIEELSSLELPPAAQKRLQALMDANNEGRLDPAESDDLRALVELSERLALVRGRARLLLQRKSG